MSLQHDLLPEFAVVRYRSRPSGAPVPGVLLGGRVHPIHLPALGVGSLNEVFAEWERLAGRVREPAGPGIPVTEVVLAAPVEPRQLLQTGANYRTHVIDLAVSHRPPDDPRTIEEARADAGRRMDDRAAHGAPYCFIGLPQTVVGEDEDLVLPRYSDTHDWELELAAVIGRTTFRVAAEDALESVWGYTIVNDVTTRDLVFRPDAGAIGSDWYRSKNARGFNPTGPFAVPAEDLPAWDGFDLRLDVNGTTMQDASSSELVFGLPRLIAAASEIAPLLPGDLLLTGSPAGNGQARGVFLRPGDVMTGSVSGLGTQHIRCVADE